MTSALMNPFWKSVWMTPAASGAVAPLRIVQARDSLGPAGQVRLQPERLEPDPGELVEAALVLAHRLQQLERLVVGQLDELHLDLGVEEHRLRGRDERGQLGAQRVVGELVLVEVEHVEERLGGQQVQLAQRLEVEAGGEHGLAGVEDLLGLLHGGELGDDLLLDARLLLQPRERALHGLQVGEDQLGVDRLDVVLGRHAAVDVDDVGVLEHPDHLADRVAVADVGQELVAQALALAGARARCRRCRRTTPSPGWSSATRTPRRAWAAARPARPRRRRWARSSRTGSSPRARRSWSAR